METITTEIQDSIGIITLNRPSKYNAINTQMVAELEQVLHDWKDQELRAVIITGAGKAFAAGADISQMVDFTDEQAEFFAGKGQQSLRLLEHFPAPTIAAVNGFAFGGGCELAMCCDIILAGEKAVFGQPEVKLGVIPGFGGTQRLLRRVGRQRSLELMMTGRNVPAVEAVQIGLALEVVEGDVLEAAKNMAAAIAANGPVSVQLVKQVVDQTDRADINAGLAAEAKAFGECFATADQKEGMNAFLNRRKANFIGK